MAMTPKEREAFLGGVEIFARCKKRDLRALSKTAEERRYSPGQALCEQGTSGVAMYVLTGGQVRVEQHLDDGRTVVMAKLGPGAVVGEMALIDGAARTASVVAETEVQALVLTSWEFQALLHKRPIIALDILPVLVRRCRSLAVELRRQTPG